MKHKDEILKLLDTIITCGESLAKLGQLLREALSEFDSLASLTNNTEPTVIKSATPTEKTDTFQSELTFTEIRKAFSAKSHEGYTVQIKELINKYGAERLSDIKEQDYSSIMKDLEAIQ